MVLIHDNKILSVEFFPNETKLIMKTKSIINNRFEYINIIFLDVYAYSFNEFGKENVIDEVAENPLPGWLHWYYTNDNSQRRSTMEYGIPLSFADKESAINELVGIYNYYEINASIGMDGWVIAKKMEVK